MYITPRARNLILAFVFLCLVVVTIFWVQKGLSYISVTISTDSDNNYVSIVPIVNEIKQTSLEQQAKHSLKVSIKPGSYEISAYNNSYIITRIISVSAHKSLDINLNPAASTAAAPAYGDSVTGVTENESGLVFLGSNNALDSLSPSGRLATIYQGNTLADLVWANSSFGLARDLTGDIYVINGGSVSHLVLPFSANGSTPLIYQPAADGTIYLSDGLNIYVGNISGNFHPIYSPTLGRTIVGMSVSGNNLALIQTADRNTPEPEGQITSFNIATGKTTLNSLTTQGLSWSPDGQYLLAVSDGDYAVLNTSLKVITTLPFNSPSVYAWSGGHTLLYSQGGVLWSYDIALQQSEKLINSTGQGNIEGIYPSPDGSYIYLSISSLTISGDQGPNELYKLGLQGQPVDNSISGLGAALPETLSGCKISYANLSQEDILITYPPGGSAQSCMSLAQGSLSTFGFKPSQFQYITTPQ